MGDREITLIGPAATDDALIEAGNLTAVIDKTSPLSQLPQAVRYLAEGHGGGGKIVITV